MRLELSLDTFWLLASIQEKYTNRGVKVNQMETIKNIYCVGRNYREHAKELNNPGD